MPELLIEFYDSESIYNYTALLNEEYEAMAFFCGPDNEPDAREEKRVKEFTLSRFGILPEFITINTGSVEKAAMKLAERIGDRSADIDLTGGSGLYSAAAGYFYKSAGGNVRLLLFKADENRLVFSSPQGIRLRKKDTLSFADCLAMNGRKVISVGGDGQYNFGSRSLRTEILRLWDATRVIPADWNRFCSLTHEDSTGEHLHTRLRRKLKKEDDRIVCERVMAALKKKHIIYAYSFIKDGVREYLEYELFYSAKTKSLYEKGGTALEMFTCLAAYESGLFTDCQTGVMVDLDGDVTGLPFDPKNEIDMTAMLGNRPVFISCKNTVPTKEYLYEIREMAGFFGGRYAICALACTPEAQNGVRERAEQMGVILIDNLYGKTLTALKNRFVEEFGKNITEKN